jgi:hypothetical protein
MTVADASEVGLATTILGAAMMGKMLEYQLGAAIGPVAESVAIALTMMVTTIGEHHQEAAAVSLEDGMTLM